MFIRVTSNLRIYSTRYGKLLYCDRIADEKLIACISSFSYEPDKSNGSSNKYEGKNNKSRSQTPLVWSSIIAGLIFSKPSDKDEDKNKSYIKTLKDSLKKHDLTDFLHYIMSKDPTLVSYLSSQLLVQAHALEMHNTDFQMSKESSSNNNQQTTSTGTSQSLLNVSQPTLEELQEELLRQQIRFQKEFERIERENRELKRSLSLLGKRGGVMKQLKRSLIDMYSEILDAVSDYQASHANQDGVVFHLPRVVVIGDQSSGKTSVLEMIVQARIFPRGSGEMMTRSPVQVTLSEGPYHVARFKDEVREYNLTQESELEELRKEIERRMARITEGRTVSNEAISLSVQGPGLQRMVLVDLPGVISTVTNGMADDTKEKIRDMCHQHMSNPNAIILCIQDGSLDAERSLITDMVNNADPKGKRSIFVLTKADLAESHLTNPDKVRQILDGKLFPMKALGYFAVVTGRGNSNDSIKTIKEYEQTFFRSSKLFRGAALNVHQMGTMNLCMAVSKCFWEMVMESLDQQAAAFEARKFNLESEWKNLFPKHREMDREELFERARNDILDKVVDLSQISAKHWDEAISKNLWKEMSKYIFDNIYLPAAQFKNPGYFNTTVDIKLREWAEKVLCKRSIEIGQETLEQEFYKLMTSAPSPSTRSGDDNGIFDDLNREIIEEVRKHRRWEEETENNLRVFQRSTLDDRSIPDKQQWDEAISFMKASLTERKKEGEEILDDMLGPSTWQQYIWWQSRTPEQSNRRILKDELEKMFGTNASHGQKLSHEELIAIRKNLESRSVEVDNNFVNETWQHLYGQQFYDRALKTAEDCVKGFYYYHNGIKDDVVDSSELIMFWRISKLLKNMSKDIRQHIMNYETQRIEKDMKQILNEVGEDEARLKKLLKGRRVELADEIKSVRHILKLLEEFNQEFNEDRV